MIHALAWSLCTCSQQSGCWRVPVCWYHVSYLVWSHSPWDRRSHSWGFTPPSLPCFVCRHWFSIRVTVCTLLALSVKCKHEGWKSNQTRKTPNVSFCYLLQISSTRYENEFFSYIPLTIQRQWYSRKYEFYESWKRNVLLFVFPYGNKRLLIHCLLTIHWLSLYAIIVQ